MIGPPDSAHFLAHRLICSTILWLTDGKPVPLLQLPDCEGADEVLRIVKRHGLTSALYSALAAQCSDAAQRYPKLRREYLTSQLRAVRALEGLRVCVQALQTAGVRCIPFKGADYMLRLYADIGHRFLSDIDLLVQDEDARRAIETLESVGYHYEEVPFSAEQEWLDLHYLRGLVLERGTDFPVDLHCNLLRGYGNREVGLEQMWEQSCTLDHCGFTVEMLRLEHAFIVSSVHLYSNYVRAVPYLKDAADLLLLSRAIEQDGAWDVMWRAAREWDVETAVSGVAAMLNTELDARIPLHTDVRHPLSIGALIRLPRTLRGRGRISEYLWTVIRAAKYLPSHSARLRLVAGFLFPGAQYLRRRFRADATAPIWKLRLRFLTRGVRRLASDVALRFVSGRK